MKRPLRFLATAVLAVLLLTNSAEAQPAIILVRHAEKADNSADPPLSADGKARAARLAEMLKAMRVTQVFATDFQRTRAFGYAPAAAQSAGSSGSGDDRAGGFWKPLHGRAGRRQKAAGAAAPLLMAPHEGVGFSTGALVITG